MKYWNKDKSIRQKHWYAVPRNRDVKWDYHTVKRKLQLCDSTGKFYLYYGSTTIWFEREQDAMWYSLITS